MARVITIVRESTHERRTLSKFDDVHGIDVDIYTIELN
jgi:hypothetical protein